MEFSDRSQQSSKYFSRKRMNELKQLKRQILKYSKSVLLRGCFFINQVFNYVSVKYQFSQNFILKCIKRNTMDANGMLTWSINALEVYFS